MILRNELIKFYEAMHIKMGMTMDVPLGISIIDDVDMYLDKEQLRLCGVVVPLCGYCNDTGWDSYPNHDTTQRPCPECQP